MPRRPRLAAGDLAYHVLNRRVGRLPLTMPRTYCWAQAWLVTYRVCGAHATREGPTTPPPLL